MKCFLDIYRRDSSPRRGGIQNDKKKRIYFFALCIVLMHLTQALILLPDANFTHWRFGYFLFVEVGLYLPLSLTKVVDLIDFFPQSGQVRAIDLVN